MTTAVLTGIRKANGTCADCARELTVQVFTVRAADGTERDLGRRCATKATGYRGNLDREAQRIARVAVVTARRQALLAEGVTETLASVYAAADAWWEGRDASAVAVIATAA